MYNDRQENTHPYFFIGCAAPFWLRDGQRV